MIFCNREHFKKNETQCFFLKKLGRFLCKDCYYEEIGANAFFEWYGKEIKKGKESE